MPRGPATITEAAPGRAAPQATPAAEALQEAVRATGALPLGALVRSSALLPRSAGERTVEPALVARVMGAPVVGRASLLGPSVSPVVPTMAALEVRLGAAVLQAPQARLGAAARAWVGDRKSVG